MVEFIRLGVWVAVFMCPFRIVHMDWIFSPESAQGLIQGVYPFCPYPLAFQPTAFHIGESASEARTQEGRADYT